MTTTPHGPLRVLMFGWEFPPYQTGGLATATVGLVKGLLRHDVSVTLVVPFPIGESPLPGLHLVSAAETRTRFRHLRIASPVVAYGAEEEYVATYAQRVEGTRGTAVYGANLFDEVDRLAAVAGLIASAEPHDVIHAHDWITYGAGIEARRVSHRPLVLHIHATEFDRAGEGANPEIVRREAEGLAAADLVIANSHALKRQIVSRYGLPADRIEVVHWGIDDRPARWSAARPNPLPETDPVVLFLGRVTRQKGPDYFIEMARRVAAFVPEARFVVAGTGDMLPRIVEQAVAAGLADRVHFAGALGGVEVDRAYRLARVCVMTSVSEPFGLVALESLQCGTPCLIPRESGAAEVLRNALPVDFWDIEEMTNKVVAILRHEELYAELRDRGLDEVRSNRFSLEEPARRAESAYRRAVARHAPEIPGGRNDRPRRTAVAPAGT